MKVRGISLAECERIAGTMGLRLERPQQISKNTISFGIRRVSKFSAYQKYGMSRKNDGTPRIAGSAVCWHGHFDFLHALFQHAPDAVVITTLATYRGQQDFLAGCNMTYYCNVGTPYRPQIAGEMCECDR